jgi:hypothetical protein
MKTMSSKVPMRIEKARFLYCSTLVMSLFTILMPLILPAQVKQSEKISPANIDIVGRLPLTEKDPRLNQINGSVERLQVPVSIKDNAKTGQVIRYGAYAKKVNRIITSDEGIDRHVVTHMSLNVYTGDGHLIKSLGQVVNIPFVNTITESGCTIIAGNKNPPGENQAIYLTKYDKDGNKQWETKLPDLHPHRIITSTDDKYIAVMMYDPQTRIAKILYFGGSGKLLFTDNEKQGASGIEFLRDDKVVICTATNWYLYSIAQGFKLLLSGLLPGEPAGYFPISAHPSKNIFTILTEYKNGFRLQAFNSSTGELIGENIIKAEPLSTTSRITEISSDGTVQLLTKDEVISLKIKQ